MTRKKVLRVVLAASTESRPLNLGALMFSGSNPEICSLSSLTLSATKPRCSSRVSKVSLIESISRQIACNSSSISKTRPSSWSSYSYIYSCSNSSLSLLIINSVNLSPSSNISSSMSSFCLTYFYMYSLSS